MNSIVLYTYFMMRKAEAALSLIAINLAFLTCCISTAAATPRPNLMLITFDSTRADRMGFLGSKLGLTPHLDRLAGESVVYEHAYSQAPGVVVSTASILSGAYPQSTGMSEIGGTLSSALPYSPELLKAKGYRTAAFVNSIDLDPRNGLAQGYDRGFDTYDAGFSTAIPGDSKPPLVERSGEQVVAHAIAWLNTKKQEPFFVWIHIGDPRASATSYDSGVRATDAAVGKLIRGLQQAQVYDNTAVIVAAANGESLGAHGEEAHGIFLYNETIHVPLLIKLPRGQSSPKQPARRVTAKARLVDVAPSLLEIAGIPVPSQMPGQSLLRIAKSEADQPVYSRSDLPQRGFGWSQLEAWRAGKYLYIRAPQPELYDLTADPGVTKNLAQSSKATLDTMAAQLDQFDRHFNGEASKTSAELSSSEMQKLASLGYIGLQKSSGAAATVVGIDPKEKDKIALANKVIAAASSRSRPDRVIAALEPIVSAEPNLYLAQYSLGVALANKAKYAEAVKHLHKAIELQPDSGWAHYAMGASLLKTGDYKTAIIHLEIAAGRLPSFTPAHLFLAEAYEHAGRAEDAKRERSKAAQK
jgi:arylsulfatase A-like enzyme